LEARGNIDYLFDESVSMLFGRTGSVPIVAWILDSTESGQYLSFISKISRKLNELSFTDFGFAREEIFSLAIHMSEFGNIEIVELLCKSDYFDSDLRFRMALILEFRGESKIAQEIFETLANNDNAYEDTRVQAAERIAEHSGIEKVMHTLIQMAHTNTLSRDFRVRAVECLQNHGCFDEAALCWVNLAKDPNIDLDPWHSKPWVRRRAIESLFHLKRVNELIELAQDKKLDGFARFEAARFLGTLGYIDESIAVLTDMLFDTTEWLGTRREVAYWLEKFAQPTHLNVLQNLAIQEQDDEIRRTLLQAIARLAQTDQQGDER